MSEKPPFYLRPWFVPAVALLALLVRALFALYYPHAAAPDEASWRTAATDLSSGRGFTEVLRHPGYIAFLALVFKLFGTGDTAVRLAQAALGALQCLLVYSLARSLFKKELPARLSALFLALYPYAIFHSAHLLSEAFYSFLLTLFLALLYLLPDRRNALPIAVAAGAAFGLAVLTKSTVLVAAPFILLWFALNRLPARCAAAFVLGAGLCVLPWTARNYRVHGKLILVNMSGSYLFQANNPETMRIELETRRLKEVDWYTPEYEEIAKLPPVEADREYTARALAFMRSNPGTVLELMRMRLLHFWRLYPITDSAPQRLAALFTSGVFIPLSFAGLLLSAPAWKKTFLIWALVFAYNLAHTLFVCTLRYRVPLDPLLLIFAAYALTDLYGRFAARRASRQ